MKANGIRGLDSNELKFGEKMLQEIAAQLADLVDQLADLVDSSEGLETTMQRIDHKLEILEAACIKWMPREPEDIDVRLHRLDQEMTKKRGKRS